MFYFTCDRSFSGDLLLMTMTMTMMMLLLRNSRNGPTPKATNAVEEVYGNMQSGDDYILSSGVFKNLKRGCPGVHFSCAFLKVFKFYHIFHIKY